MLSDAEVDAISPHALALLTAFRAGPRDGLTATEAARAAGVPPKPAVRLTRQLREAGVLEVRSRDRYVVPGTPLPPPKPRIDVRHAASLASARKRPEPKTFTCRQCGREFQSTGSRAMFCQARCADRFGKARRNAASQDQRKR